jgi:glycosyltransferase involved in cell wall biosynthesis
MKAVFQVVEAVLVYRYCVRQGVTAIHAHFGHAPASVALFASRLGNAIGRDRWSWSVTIHGYHEFATEDTARLRQKMIEVDGVAAISHFTRAQLMRLSEPRDWPKISVVRCGIDLGVFRLRSATDAGPASSRPLVVVIGRLSPEKGHAVLIDAVEILRDRGVDLDVHCAGEGPLRGELEGRVATAGLSDRVQLLGALPPAEVTQLLHRADVFCLPSFTEGLPVSVMEAMAVGVPVVASAITGMPELVADGSTGWTVPAGSATLLADALLRALEAPDREEIVAAARRAVERQHDIRRTIVDLERVLVSAHGGELVQPDESTVDER